VRSVTEGAYSLGLMTWLGARLGLPELVPGALAVASFVLLAAADGGSRPTTWYPVALFLLGLLVVSTLVLARGRRLAPAPVALVAIALLGAFTLWTFASIGWAEAKGDAWTGANRTLLYLIVFSLFAILPWRPRSAALVLGGYSVAIATVGLIALLGTAGSDAPGLSLIAGRFSEPVGYHNGVTGLLLAAAWPAAYLASVRRVHPLARGLLLAACVVLVQVAVIPQSRGSAVAVPLTALLYVALVPGRLRAIAVLIPVAAATALAMQPLLNVYDAFADGGDLAAAFDDAARAVVLSGAALFCIGLVAALVDQRLERSRQAVHRLKVAASAALVAGALAGVVVALATIGDPVSWIDERVQEFKTESGEPAPGSSRFSEGLGSVRYDFWRVAVDVFAERPLVGAGSESFAIDYLRERETDQEPANPHSVELRLLSQTGLVGTALFGGFLVCAVMAASRVRRSRSRLAAGSCAAALVAFAYWLIHGSADWFWELPALGAAAFAWLGMAGAIRDDDEDAARDASRDEPEPPVLRRYLAVGAAGLALLSAGSLVLTWAAARSADRAASSWTANPELALERIDSALDLNPLDENPALLGGVIAARTSDNEAAREYFGEAIERNGSSWFGHLELGALDAMEGRRRSALAHLRLASELNPRDPVVRSTRRRAERGRAVSLRMIDRALLRRVCLRFGRTDATPFCASTT